MTAMIRQMKLIAAALAAVIVLFGSGSADAAFVLVEDFNALSTGGVNGQNGWTADSATVNVIDTAPASASDKALQNGDNSTEAYKTIPTIADGATGTAFFQFHLTSLTPGQSWGLADSSIGATAFDSYRPQIALNAAGNFVALDGGSSAAIDNVSLSTGVWYSIWMVTNNASNDYQVYIQGGSIASQTQLTASGDGTFAFRNTETSSAALTNFLFARGTGTADSVAIDNLYVDNAGQNLANPIAAVIPTPAALPAGLALMGLIAMRHRAH